MRDRTRELATIETVQVDESHGFHTVWVGCNLGGGGHQGFGGIALGKGDEGKRMQEVWLQEIRAVLGAGGIIRGTHVIEDLATTLTGTKCYALRHFNNYNEFIVGLEHPTSGRRFLADDFARRHFPDDVKQEHPLEARKERIRRRIAADEKRLNELKQSLTTIDNKFAAWAREAYGG